MKKYIIILGVLCLAGCAAKDDVTSTEDVSSTEEIVESSVASSEELESYNINTALVVPEMSEVSEHVYSITIDDAVYTIPFNVQDLLSAGWSSDASKETYPGQTQYILLTKENATIGTTVMNKGTSVADILDCNVVGISISAGTDNNAYYAGIVTSVGLSLGDKRHRVETATADFVVEEFDDDELATNSILRTFTDGEVGYETYQLIDNILYNYTMYYIGN